MLVLHHGKVYSLSLELHLVIAVVQLLVAWLAGARWHTSSGGLETREQLSLPATCGQPAVAKLLLEICHPHAGVVSHGRASERVD